MRSRVSSFGNRGGGGYAPSRRIVPRWGRCHRAGEGGLPDAGVCMPSLGRVEAAGSFGLMRAPGMTVPVGVQSASPMAWESKRDDAGHEQTRTGVVDSPGKWLGPCGSEAPLGSGWYTPPGVPPELEGGTSKGPRVPLAPYDGKTDLRAYMAQFQCVARGNG